MSRDLEYAAQLVAAMRAAGIHPNEDVAVKLVARTGEMIRFGCHGERKGKRNGYAILHLDGRPAGVFGNWATQTKGTWRADNHSHGTFSRHVLSQNRIAKVEATALQIDEVAKTAEQLLAKSQPAKESHPYLVLKGLPPIGLRQQHDELLVPLTDIFGKLWNLQRINANGSKFYLRGPRRERIFWSAALGLAQDVARDPERIYLGEGPQILNWMIEGCIDWRKHGLVRPDVVAEATAEYFEEQDVFGQWIRDCCEVTSGGREQPTTLFNDWARYARERSEEAGNMKSFTAALRRHGFRKGSSGGYRWWFGLQLKHRMTSE